MFRVWKQFFKCNMGIACHFHDVGEPFEKVEKAPCGEVRNTDVYQRIRCCGCGTEENSWRWPPPEVR